MRLRIVVDKLCWWHVALNIAAVKDYGFPLSPFLSQRLLRSNLCLRRVKGSIEAPFLSIFLIQPPFLQALPGNLHMKQNFLCKKRIRRCPKWALPNADNGHYIAV